MSRLLTITLPKNGDKPISYYSILDPQYSPRPFNPTRSIINEFGFTKPNYEYGRRLCDKSIHKNNPNVGMKAKNNAQCKLIESKILKEKYDILTHTINMLYKQIQKTLLNGKDISEELQQEYDNAWSKRSLINKIYNNAWSKRATNNAMKGKNSHKNSHKKRKSLRKSNRNRNSNSNSNSNNNNLP
jgi:Txe/YoeB family toxin of Txe-Axe toxin-antitoxin module